MQRHEIESWAWRAIAHVKGGERAEDHGVELKGEWPADPGRAAHRIAGHGNAAHGEPFLWLIGIDETRGVIGAGPVDVGKWYQQIESYFEGHAPEMKPVNLLVDGHPVVALFFGTERAPFVVKNPGGGYPQFVVPWREGTLLRAAKRDELLRILSPLQRMPDIEVVGAALEMGVPDRTRSQIWGIALKVFVTPKDSHQIVIPFYRCKGELMFPNQNFKHPFSKIAIQSHSRNSETIHATETEAVITSPGMLMLTAEIALPNRGEARWGRPCHI